MTGRRRKRHNAQPYSSPVSPDFRARLERKYNRDAMRQWAEETGVADRIVNLIVAASEEVQEQDG